MADRLSAARALGEIGRRLQIVGGNPFRAKAFVRGAGALSGQSADLATLVREKRLQKLRGTRRCEKLHDRRHPALYRR